MDNTIKSVLRTNLHRFLCVETFRFQTGFRLSFFLLKKYDLFQVFNTLKKQMCTFTAFYLFSNTSAMGNSGSISTLNNSKHASSNNNKTNRNDLYAYYSQQQYNNRQHVMQLLRKYDENETVALMGEESENHRSCRLQQQLPDFQVWANKSLPHISQIIKTNNNTQKAQYKVLPELCDCDILKLRSTTNGFILHSGGTISRREHDASNKININSHSISNTIIDKIQMNRNSLPLPVQLERSRTFINEMKHKPTLVDNQHLFLRRMQTESDLPSSKLNTVNSKQQIRPPPTVQKRYPKNTDETVLNVALTLRKKNNKYKKKRKAPLAPIEIQTVITGHALTGVSVENVENSKISDMNTRTDAQKLAASHLFQLQCNRKQSIVDSETNILSIKKTETTDQTKQQYLRHPQLHKYNSQGVNDTTASMFLTKTDSNIDNDEQENTNDKNSSNIISVCKSNSTDNVNINKIDLTSNSPNIVTSTLMTNKDISVKPSKMTQLKQTFYFGMAKTVIKKPNYNEQLSNSVRLLANLESPPNANLAADERGLLVHVLPTLPRRQLEMPSFSPMYAWRALAEAQHHMQLSCNDRQHVNLGVQDNKQTHSPVEQPLEIKRSIKNVDLSTVKNKQHLHTWIPQQDIDGDDDVASTMHIAHDFEMQSDIANSLTNETYACNNNIRDSSSSKDEINDSDYFDRLKSYHTIESSKNSLLHTLQVFNMFLPRETYMDSYSKEFVNDKFGNHLKFPDMLRFVTGNNDAKDSLSYNYRSNNWMLYKSDSGCSSLQALSKNYGTHITTDKVDWSKLPASIEPHFLTSLTSAKHVMYLPNANAANNNQHAKIHKIKNNVSQTVSRFNDRNSKDEEVVRCQREFST